MVISDGIPGVPRNRKSRNSVPNPSAEEITTRKSVPWNKNGSKLSEFRFRTLPKKRKEHGFPFRGTKIEGNSPFRTINSEQNAAAENFKIVLEKTTFEEWTNHFVK
jgi:hypothetical protein